MSKPTYDKKSNDNPNALNNNPVDNDNGLNNAQTDAPRFVTPTHGGVDILKLLSELEDVVEKAHKIFGGVYYGFDEDKFHMTLMKIRANLPDQIKNASKLMRDSERLADETSKQAEQVVKEAQKSATTEIERTRSEASRLKQEADKSAKTTVKRAEEDAEGIITAARERAALMVSDTEIVQRAQIEAQELLQRAHAEAQSIQNGANDYAYEVLTNLEGVLGKATSVVQNGRVTLEKPPSRR